MEHRCLQVCSDHSVASTRLQSSRCLSRNQLLPEWHRLRLPVLVQAAEGRNSAADAEFDRRHGDLRRGIQIWFPGREEHQAVVSDDIQHGGEGWGRLSVRRQITRCCGRRRGCDKNRERLLVVLTPDWCVSDQTGEERQPQVRKMVSDGFIPASWENKTCREQILTGRWRHNTGQDRQLWDHEDVLTEMETGRNFHWNNSKKREINQRKNYSLWRIKKTTTIFIFKASFWSNTTSDHKGEAHDFWPI